MGGQEAELIDIWHQESGLLIGMDVHNMSLIETY